MLKSWIFAALRINCRRENSDFAQDLNFLNICGESQSLQKFTTTTIKSSRNAIFPIIYPKYFPFAIITFLVNLNIHQIPLPRFILKVYCPIKLLNNELVCVMTQHRKVAADENIFVNTHNERRGGDGEKWGDNAAAGNMLSWRRLACREAAVRPQAYLMLFPLPTLVFFKIGPKQQKNWQKFLKKIMQSSIFWFCSYAYESVDSKHNEWQMRAKKW